MSYWTDTTPSEQVTITSVFVEPTYCNLYKLTFYTDGGCQNAAVYPAGNGNMCFEGPGSSFDMPSLSFTVLYDGLCP
jgi:hypothetical protein